MSDRDMYIKQLEEKLTHVVRDTGRTTVCMPVLDLAIIVNLLKESQEQKHGHWVLDPDGMDWNIPAWRCSVCGCRNDNIPPNLEKTNPLRWSGSRFCPNCGAKMDEEVKQDETD